MRIPSIAVIAAGLLGACATRPAVPVGIYQPQPFVLEEALAGERVAEGSIRTITGVDRGFKAELSGMWDGTTLTLVEDFLFDDGETDQKTWRLTKVADGEYEGTREDVVGIARGFNDGDVFRLEYLIDLPTGEGKSTRVKFRDVLVLGADGVVLNEATIGYWGFRVGRVSLTMDRAAAS